ncbi:hypothetical protein Scep_018799 [Stephania cephalantha]|uniref:Uncharacterized protein n=1 Tax=Stephania cephalantha TaxID=152367 RepID=A0AAP0NML5_9MAGN
MTMGVVVSKHLLPCGTTLKLLLIQAKNANHECSGDDVLESGLRLAGTVIRRSTAWSRGNPRVCYALALVHRGEAWPTTVSVCESWSRRRGDPKLSQGYMRRATAAEEPGASSGGIKRVPRWRKRWPAVETEGTRGGGKGGQGRSDARPDGVDVHKRRSAVP